MFSLICVWINDWVNNREDGYLRRYRRHYDVIVTPRRPAKFCTGFLLCVVLLWFFIGHWHWISKATPPPPNAIAATMNILIIWIRKDILAYNNHSKTNHNKIARIFDGIYCVCMEPHQWISLSITSSVVIKTPKTNPLCTCDCLVHCCEEPISLNEASNSIRHAEF